MLRTGCFSLPFTRLIYCLILGVLTTLIMPVYANQFFFDVQRFSVKDGLPDSTVFSITTDQQGYIWLGTPNGLSRFNGRTFDNFSAVDPKGTQISTINNSNIFKDSQQRLWVGTWGQGVYVYDRNLTLLHHFSTEGQAGQIIKSDLVQVFFEDSEGDVWIGTNGGGVAMFSSSTASIEVFAHNSGDTSSISHNRIWHIAEERPGTIWLGTGNGLDRIQKNNQFVVTRFNSVASQDDPLYEKRVRRILIDDSRTIWVGTEVGVCMVNTDRSGCQYLPRFDKENTADPRVTSLVMTDDKKMWIGTLSGLYLYDLETESFVPLANGSRLALLPNDDIRDIFIDPSGSLWVASRPSGLIKISLVGDAIKGFTQFTRSQGTIENIGRVQSLFMDSESNLWVGSTQGLLKMKPGDIRPHFVTDELGVVVAMLEDRAGRLWFGSNLGLFRRSSQGDSFTHLQSEFPTKNKYVVESLFEDSSGNVWIGTFHQGLFMFASDTIEAVKFDEQIPQLSRSAILTIGEDRHQFIIVGILGYGIFRFSLESNKTLTYQAGTEGSLSDNGVVDILKDNENVLWIGTNSKLNKLDDISNTFQYFPRGYTTKNLVVKKLLNDQENNIWFSTGNGIYRLDAGQSSIAHYTIENGLHSDEFVNKSGFASSTGELYFGGSRGFTRIRTTSLESEEIEPKTTINQVSIDAQKILFIDNNASLTYSMPYSVKDVTFEFSDLNFITKFKNQFSHRLIGHNDEWSVPSTLPNTIYSGLSPGTYEFQVVSVFNDQMGKDIASFKFRISPPWWHSWSARGLYLIIFVLLVWVWSRWRVRNLKARNTVLQQEVEMRSNALIDAQTKLIESEKNASISSLVVGVAHEINTPVGIGVTASTFIHDDANTLLEKFRDNQITKSEFERRLTNICDSAMLISKNLDKANNLIHSFKNLSTDQISQTKRDIHLKDYIGEVLNNLSPTLNRANVRWQLSCPENILIASYPGAIAQLITQLALNAIEHAFDGIVSPSIDVDVHASDGNVILRFKDNGVGINDEMKEKIFQPFFTTKRVSGSVGLGLQIVSNIVTIRLGGNIQVFDNSPKGVVFQCEFSS